MPSKKAVRIKTIKNGFNGKHLQKDYFSSFYSRCCAPFFCLEWMDIQILLQKGFNSDKADITSQKCQLWRKKTSCIKNLKVMHLTPRLCSWEGKRLHDDYENEILQSSISSWKTRRRKRRGKKCMSRSYALINGPSELWWLCLSTASVSPRAGWATDEPGTWCRHRWWWSMHICQIRSSSIPTRLLDLLMNFFLTVSTLRAYL